MAAAVEKPISLFDIVDTLLLVRSFAGLIELSRNVAAPAGCLSKVQARNSIVLVVLHKFLRYRENFITVQIGLFGFLPIGKCFDIPPGPLGIFPRLGPATRPNRIGGFQGIYR
jgi:hypothetical protein